MSQDARIRYFAYGSNLDTVQMGRRCPGARITSTATITGYRLAFTGESPGWGGAIATLVPERGDAVQGLLWSLPVITLPALDSYEGHPSLYRRVRRYVIDEFGERARAHVYIRALEGGERPAGAPYLEVLIRAYKRFQLDRSALDRALERATSDGLRA
jgi:gamma-glutamylcyclotransferase (GGCT)/AIG2-like uncharacterized protein YtfP